MILNKMERAGFPKSYGPLAVPVILLIVFSLFGTRPSMTGYHPAVNVFFILNTSVTTVIGILCCKMLLSGEPTADNISWLANFVFVPLAVLYLLLWLVTSFKKHNISILLDNIVETRRSTLKTTDKIWIAAMQCASVCPVLPSCGKSTSQK